MNIQRDTEYRFGELVLSPEYSNEQGVVVMIKSLATGLTMKVYLDEPILEVDGGINYIDYTGHFDEEEFMITSEGFEVTGLPLMYPLSAYDADSTTTGVITVVDTENHYYREKPTNLTGSVNLADFPLSITFIEPISGNHVTYEFSRSDSTSEEPGLIPAEPVVPIGGGTTPKT